MSVRSVLKPESRGEVLVEISHLTHELLMSLGIENQVPRLVLKACGYYSILLYFSLLTQDNHVNCMLYFSGPRLSTLNYFTNYKYRNEIAWKLSCYGKFCNLEEYILITFSSIVIIQLIPGYGTRVA